MTRRSLLLEPNNPNTEGGGVTNTPPASQTPPTPVAPYSVREKSDKVPAGITKAKELPEESKKFQFKADPSLVTTDEQVDVKSNVVDIKATTPLDVANALLKDKPAASEKAKAEPTDKVTVEKPEAPIVQAAKVEPEKKAPVQHDGPIVPKAKGTTVEFDYTGHNEQEQHILKNMSVEARKHVSKLMKDNKELSQYKDGQYMQHPDAYVLDPQFSTLQEDVVYYNKEAKFWQDQVVKISNGEKWTPLKGFDKQGNPVAGDEQLPTVIAGEQARINMNRLLNAAQNKEQELHQFAGNYKQRIQQDSQAIQAERAKRFGWVADPSIMKSTFNLPDGKEVTVEQARNTLIQLFPPYMRNTLGVEVAADLFAAFQIQNEELRNQSAGKNLEQVQQKEVARAEPTSHKSNAEDTSKKSIRGVKEFSLQGMPV